MSKISPHSCNICGIPKSEFNGWWVMECFRSCLIIHEWVEEIALRGHDDPTVLALCSLECRATAESRWNDTRARYAQKEN